MKVLYKIIVLLLPTECFKESLGYRCKHQMHGDVLECGSYE